MDKETQTVLVEPFPEDAIRSRRGNHGKQLHYLETWRVIDRLNQAFGHDWNFRIHEWKVMENEVVVHAEVEAAGVVKQAFGSSCITRSRESGDAVSIGDDLKSASSDGLKKASSKFGIGLHLYSGKPAPAPGELETPKTPGSNGRLTDRQLRAILAVAGQKGMSEAEIRTKILDSFGAPLEQLGRKEASQLITKLNNGSAEGGAS